MFLIVLKALNKLVALNMARGSPRRGSKCTLLRESPGTNILKQTSEKLHLVQSLLFTKERSGSPEMYSGLPGAAELLGAKPRLQPELEFFLVWPESRNLAPTTHPSISLSTPL